MLTCNVQLVLSSVAIGKVHSLRPYDVNHPPSGLSIIFSALKAIRILRLHNYTLTTGKDHKINFAALGMVVVDQTQSSLVGRCFSEVLSNIDGRLTLLTFSPRSVLSYLWVLFLLVIPKKISLSNLPDSIGLIRSKHIQLEANKEIEYLLDGASITAKIIQFQVLDLKLRIIPGSALVHGEENNLVKEKDNIKIRHLPIDQTAQEVTQSSLPFFSRAGEADYQELFVSLRNNAKLSSSFLVLMILSVLLALSGLYANSAPVIIGAMILAPLMSPIISGVAGAYAHAKEEVAKSLAGVAIAVALIPPLSVVGIGIGWSD